MKGLARNLGVFAAPVERRYAKHPSEQLVFDEYIRAGKARHGTRTSMGGVVARIIPEDI